MSYEVKADPLASAFESVTIATQPMARPILAGEQAVDPARRAFVDGFLRRGSDVELKSISGVVAGDGGVAVPREIDAQIDATLKTISPIRAIANVVRVGSAGYRKLVTKGGVASGWASEAGARPETATPAFNEVVPAFGDLYANPAATQAMLDDAEFDVEGWLASEIATEFAHAEGAAFVSGNGVNKPRGFLTGMPTNQDDGVRPFGTLQYHPTGNATGFLSTNPEDVLVSFIHKLRAPYRQGAVWVMNAQTLAMIRSWKTADGAFIWQAGLAVGQPDTLLGYPVVEAEEMPDAAVNNFPIAFGNFKAGYLIAERSDTQVLRDPFSNKPFVHFYATKRVGGIVSNSEAIKLLKIAVS